MAHSALHTTSRCAGSRWEGGRFVDMPEVQSGSVHASNSRGVASRAPYTCGDGLGISGAGGEDDVRCGIRASSPVQHPSRPRVRSISRLSPRVCRQDGSPLLHLTARHRRPHLARRASLLVLPGEILPPAGGPS
eukprot:scaffold21281_cov64-Phaeocystis_antarctica.AAC.4